MRRMVDACVGCGKSPCFRCESEVVECDGCGIDITENGKVFYSLPNDDGEYCADCFKSSITDLGEVEECPECGAMDVHLYRCGEEVACSSCGEEAWGQSL